MDEVSEKELGTGKISSSRLLFSGGVAGACAKTCIAPGDRVKIIFQVTDRKFSFSKAFRLGRDILRSDGVFALWRGHCATLSRVIPYAAVMYFSFDRFKSFYESLAKPSSFVNGISGASAGATAVLVTYPLDVMRARAAVSRGKFNYFSPVPWRNAYSGLSPTLLGIIPYSGIAFCLYEGLKREDSSSREKLGIGAFAGLVGQSVTYPLDIVRRRMQVDSSYTSFVNTLKVLNRRQLFNAVSMNWIKGPIATAISFTVNDLLKDSFRLKC